MQAKKAGADVREVDNSMGELADRRADLGSPRRPSRAPRGRSTRAPTRSW
ncbi:hypothetical protein LV779_21240 [Streptomyces thinghirensis]|nr:hypothetical protein [Streptomyces thinghirensis]